MSSHIHQFLDRGEVQTIEEQLRDINAVSEDQVMRAAEQLLRREKVCATICAAPDMRAEMVEAAESLDF